MKTPPAPRSHRRWLDATEATWKAWMATPVAAHWSPAERVKAERLLAQVDESIRNPTDLRLTREVRLGEQSLGLSTRRRTTHNAPDPEVTLDHEYVFQRMQWKREGGLREDRPPGMKPVTASQVQAAEAAEPERWAEMRARTARPPQEPDEDFLAVLES